MGAPLFLSIKIAMFSVSRGSRSFARRVVKMSREDVKTGDQVKGDKSGR